MKLKKLKELEISEELKVYYKETAYTTINEAIRNKIMEIAVKTADEYVKNLNLDLVFMGRLDEQDVIVIKLKIKSKI